MIPPSPFRVTIPRPATRMPDSLLTHTIIIKEYVIDKERRIDLAIQNADFFIPMEPLTKKYGLELETDAKYYSYENPKHDRFYDCYSTYPGLNYVVKQASFQKKSLQMWFRIEIEQNLFAGFSLFDTEAEPQDGYLKGYQVNDITEDLINEASKYLDREIIVPENWWFAWNYSNGKRSYQEQEVPDFKAMNECAVSLVNPEKRKCYVKEAVAGFERSLLTKLHVQDQIAKK